MANVEKSGYMKYKDKSGNMTTMYPKTKVANVEGLSKALIDAQNVFLIHGNVNGTTITSDKTPSEILAAAREEKLLVLDLGLTRPTLFARNVGDLSTMIIFTGMNVDTTGTTVRTVSYVVPLVTSGSGAWGAVTKTEEPNVPAITSTESGMFLQAYYDTTYKLAFADWKSITPASIGAATITEVNSAIQSAIQNTWEASY